MNDVSTRQYEAANEAALITRLRARDQAALAELYAQYSGVVYALALKILGQPQDAEDVVVDSFWQIWQQAENYNAERGQLRSWVVTIGRSRALDRFRALRRGPMAGAEELDVNQSATTDNPEQEAWALQQSEQVRRALASLPQEQRAALELAYYYGFSQSEVAERLGEPLGTIKTRIRLGMMKLREQLGHLQGQ